MDLENKLKEIKEKSNLFAEGIKNDIYELCENLEYKESSIFSYNIDRIDAFIKEINEFKLKEDESIYICTNSEYTSYYEEEFTKHCSDCHRLLEDCTCIEDTIDMKKETK